MSAHEFVHDPTAADRRARIALSRVVEPGDRDVALLVAQVGAVEALARIEQAARRSQADGALSSYALSSPGPSSTRPSSRLPLARFAARLRTLNPDALIATGAKAGARVVIPGDDEWPDRLDDLDVPPWCLWVRGPAHLAEAVETSVALVGARLATQYGERVAADFGATLAARGWTVVSGAASGIDAAAHRGALSVDGQTVAFLAGGVERPYPAGNAALIARIAETGAVVSEISPGTAPLRSRFLMRNRLIAAVSRGTVVVEADLRSGSRNTVKHAETLRRPIGVVPGPVTSMMSSGCHQELRDNRAVAVTSPDEVIELVGTIGVDAALPARGAVLPTDGLEPDEARVHEVLPVRGHASLDRLMQVTALPVLRLRAVLTRLEDAGLAESVEGRWGKARPKKADPSPHAAGAPRARRAATASRAGTDDT